MKQRVASLLIVCFCTQALSLRCYQCTWSANQSTSSCLGPNVDDSYLIECANYFRTCSTVITQDLNTNMTTKVARACAHPVIPSCSLSPFGLACTVTCIGDACNTENEHSIDYLAGSTIKCHVCSVSVNSSDPGCMSLGSNSSYLRKCPTGENACSVRSLFNDPDGKLLVRTCSKSTPSVYSKRNGEGFCNSVCNSEGCNTNNTCWTNANTEVASLCSKSRSRSQPDQPMKSVSSCFTCDKNDLLCANETLPSTYKRPCLLPSHCFKHVHAIVGPFGRTTFQTSRNCFPNTETPFSHYVSSGLSHFCTETCDTDNCNGNIATNNAIETTILPTSDTATINVPITLKTTLGTDTTENTGISITVPTLTDAVITKNVAENQTVSSSRLATSPLQSQTTTTTGYDNNLESTSKSGSQTLNRKGRSLICLFFILTTALHFLT